MKNIYAQNNITSSSSRHCMLIRIKSILGLYLVALAFDGGLQWFPTLMCLKVIFWATEHDYLFWKIVHKQRFYNINKGSFHFCEIINNFSPLTPGNRSFIQVKERQCLFGGNLVQPIVTLLCILSFTSVNIS